LEGSDARIAFRISVLSWEGIEWHRAVQEEAVFFKRRGGRRMHKISRFSIKGKRIGIRAWRKIGSGAE